ncbi:vesicular integral-membrane protein VIP36 [Tetranychus urticae]|uniref:L-type lectin-like domain-containing protein n=1 Tax=Tetranychus urticae TaxID=32264 RepID=T1KIT3_TETUR|nr:vesicular integral-membrane protein VIP36 [Tetranychus urticae]
MLRDNLFCALLLIAVFLCDSIIGEGEYFKREHSLMKPYQGTGMVIPNWEFFGSTMVTQAFVRLTADQQSRIGGLYNKNPITFRNWAIQLHFKVSGKGKELFGDGFAFWYVKDPLELGPVFGSKDYFVGLGLFFDTYANQNGAHSHGHPYISAMINNGTQHYDHDRDGTHTELAGCEGKFRNVDHETIVEIRYENDVLSVGTDFESRGAFKECFSVKGVILPSNYYIGVSAATGELSDNHDVIAIKTFQLTSSSPSENDDRSHMLPSASQFAAPRPRIDDKPQSMSNLKFFLLIICVIIGIIIIAAVSILVFQRHQETSRKRFY